MGGGGRGGEDGGERRGEGREGKAERMAGQEGKERQFSSYDFRSPPWQTPVLAAAQQEIHVSY